MKHFIGFTALVLVAGIVGFPSPSAAASGSSALDQARATVDKALADPAKLLHQPSRTQLADALRMLPEWQQTRTIGTSVSGRVVAGTVRLPAKVVATGDLTIVADIVELTAGTVKITSDGHAINFLPLTAVHKAAATGRASTAQVFTFDSSSHSEGSTGFSGSPGFDGLDGTQGSSAYSDPNNCNNLNGGNGSEADDATAPGDGGAGGQGGDAGGITVLIPEGSQDSWDLTARGAAGGSGGPGGGGGNGGRGGDGGDGGDGAYGYYECGGTGGRGGDGSSGGGGSGSDGPGGIQKLGSGGSAGSAGSNGTVVDTPIVAITTDKPAYLVGESPVYTITGAPNTQICFTSTLNGAPTGENHTPGPFIDASGRATVTGPPWTEDHVGAWMKQVTVAGQDARAFFDVRMAGPWMDWTALGGVLTERMSAARTFNGFITYGRGTDNALYANEFDGNAWAGWRGLGGTLTSRPVAFDANHVYARAADGSVLHGFFVNGYAPQWESLGGYILGTPAVTSARCPIIGDPLRRCTVVIVRGGDNALYVNRQRDGYDLSWTGWMGLGGATTNDPVATVRVGHTASVDVENQIQLFVRNMGGGVSTRLFNGAFWEDWQDLGGSIQGTPDAKATADYSLLGFVMYTFLFARGADDSLLVNRMDNGVWTGWQSLGGVLRSEPSAVSPFAGAGVSMHVGVRGTDDGIHLRSWDRAGGWSGWRSIAGSTALTPEVFSNGVVPMVFAVDKTTGRPHTRTVYAS